MWRSKYLNSKISYEVTIEKINGLTSLSWKINFAPIIRGCLMSFKIIKFIITMLSRSMILLVYEQQWNLQQWVMIDMYRVAQESFRGFVVREWV